MKQPAQEKTGGIEELYPFLYTGHSDLTTVLQEVRRSTEEKVREIMALRDSLGHELAGRLSACAQAMAHTFRAQGKLFAFGNGGSSTDAQALAACRREICSRQVRPCSTGAYEQSLQNR
jgi:D-sedoheptulose 7-phosphate isomerase